MSNKLIVVTGKSGTGKTTLLKKINYKKTIYMDDIVKNNMYQEGGDSFKKIIKYFGKKIIQNNKINTSKLGKIVFSDKNKLTTLNEIMKNEIRQYLLSLQGTFLVEMGAYLNTISYYQDLFWKVIVINRKNQNIANKFNYLSKKKQPIKNVNIKNAININLDKQNFEEIKKIIMEVIS